MLLLLDLIRRLWQHERCCVSTWAVSMDQIGAARFVNRLLLSMPLSMNGLDLTGAELYRL